MCSVWIKKENKKENIKKENIKENITENRKENIIWKLNVFVNNGIEYCFSQKSVMNNLHTHICFSKHVLIH